MEFTADKQLLACLGPSLKQPKTKSDFTNFELSMIYFKVGNNPINIATLTFTECVFDSSLVSVMTMAQNNYAMIVAFSDCLFVVSLITVDTVSHLEVVRRIKLLPNSSLE